MLPRGSSPPIGTGCDSLMKEPRITELYESKSTHHRITVDETEGVVSLRFNGIRQSSLLTANGLDTVQRYIEFFHMTLALKSDAKSVLCVGLGGGVLPKRMWHDYPDMTIDVVELDPEVVEVARRFFGLPDDPRLRVIVGEGRQYLSATTSRYDLILVDAFFEAAIPYALVTQEFVSLAASRLAPGGVLAYNVVGIPSGRGSRQVHRFVKTISSVLPAVYVFPVNLQPSRRRQNILVMATQEVVEPAELQRRIRDCVDGRVRLSGYAEFADHLSSDPLPRGTRLYLDAETPEDGLLQG